MPAASNTAPKQHAFTRDFVKLLQKAHKMGYEVAVGEVYRDPEWQAVMLRRGKSKTQNSRHIMKLAVDLFLFKDIDPTKPGLEYLDGFHAYETLGAYWKSLSPQNVWGGDWPGLRDAVHFERKP